MNKTLWRPKNSDIEKSWMQKFIIFINEKYDISINNYSSLYKWSITENEKFWNSVSDFFKIKYSYYPQKIKEKSDIFHKDKWFVGAKLNYAQNILHPFSELNSIESYNENGQKKIITHKELARKVSNLSFFLRKIGLNKGDRVAAIMPNIEETVIASLSSAAIGSIWSSCSPEFGYEAILDRFKQISPKILFASDCYSYKGKIFNCKDTIKKIKVDIPSIKKIIVFNYKKEMRIDDSDYIYWDELDFTTLRALQFEEMDFSDPLYIMFSSGTTGKPKSIVHSVGGTLIQHVKELGLHTNLKSNEKIFYYTTCGWMMWNWLLSSLYFKSTVILYDGSQFYPEDDSLFKLANDNKINIFGTSAGYISRLNKLRLNITKKYHLPDTRLILSTGSALHPENFDYVYDYIKKDVQLSSISGGTDILSCFVLGNPMLEVRRGQIQCIGLGMDVKSYDNESNSLINKKGELVCVSSFPSMPIFFWNDKDDLIYRKAYFNKFKNKWSHGDFIEIIKDEGVVIYGRSDATLNPGGIRIGTSEIYSAISDLNFIEDSIAADYFNDEIYILFVKLKKNEKLSKEKYDKIYQNIKMKLSPKHLPGKIIQVNDIPYTSNGKKTELAVKKILNNEKIDNIDSISNPRSLKNYEIY